MEHLPRRGVMEELFRRFSRQLLLSGIGPEGMKRLRSSRVAVIGCGALGSAQAELIARAGVGFVRLVDRDVIDWSNLHRTHMVGESDAEAGTPKAIACANGVRSIDSSIGIEAVVDDVDSNNIVELVKDIDIILDGTDNMETRALINEAAVKLGKPWVYAGVNSWYGTVMLIVPERGPCLRCFMRDLPSADGNCNVIPTIGTVTTLVASVAAGLAIRYLVGDNPEPGELIVIDGRRMSMDKVKVMRDPSCPVCSLRHFDMLSKPPTIGLTMVCGSESFKARLSRPLELEVNEVGSRLSKISKSVLVRPSWVRAVVKGATVTVLPPRLILIEGVDERQARQIYDELIKALGAEQQ